ncbi:MAG: RsmB/NOP family class I SAM-dependent RNA methyltransferase [Alphaproteobacteria bacterium]|jgi:16S rRNA (cytosine967-C5)-methyltransferase|nr:RsmB/NOP family class I SAM-dependent RNA methyltransferase [Alphaproteobacteria bacterium]
MREGARLQAAITLLDKILASPAPADSVVTGYFRQCRYMGSTDRRVISEIVYQSLRRYEELAWYLQGVPAKKSGWPRLLILAYAHKIQNLTAPQIQALCQQEGQRNTFDPEPLSPLEIMLLEEMNRLKPGTMPLEVRLNIPAWVLPHLKATFGDQLEEAVHALNQPAPLDLRVNTLKATRDAVLKTLLGQGFEAIPTPWSPLGIRLKERRPLSGHELWIRGDIEVQDEGSQLLALLVEAKSGMAVVDFCAGAGGKTLAMATTMENRGRIVATDVALWRLERSRERLKRAGVNNVEFRNLEDDATVKWLKRQAGRFDRVLVDAPCSGSGTWRRNPDLKRRFNEQDLKELVVKQQQILTRAAPLVKEGGRLVYATCSLFSEENTAQVQQFLNTHPEFQILPIGEIWTCVFGTPCPMEGETLQLTPHTHAVDGFFIAVMERAKKAV